MNEKKRFVLVSKDGEPCRFVSIQDILYVTQYGGSKADGWLSTIYFRSRGQINAAVSPCVIYNRLTDKQYLKGGIDYE